MRTSLLNSDDLPGQVVYKGHKIEFYHIKSIFMLVLFTITSFIFTMLHRNMEHECDDLVKTPADFTLFVKHIPTKQNLFSKSKLKEFFNVECSKIFPELPSNTSFVHSVNLVYNVDELVQAEKEEEELLNEM